MAKAKAVKKKTIKKEVKMKKKAVSGIKPKKTAEIKKKDTKKKLKPVKAKVTKTVKKAAEKITKTVKKPAAKIFTIKSNNIISVTPPEKKVKKFKPNKKTKYSASELKYFRNIILKERKAIIESAKANMASLVDNETGEYKGDNLTYSTHMAEQGTDEMEREKNYLFVQRDEKYLGYLQDALTRIDQGTFGICIDCRDEPKNLCRTCPLIQKERLELVPITQHCIECKNLRG
ncbi:MAG TPA: conjugal transfer protein TraR [Ignavibacteria bacterium]|nr:conjugal transfer protein TraR [Ignavibacteria bacterium]